MSETLTSLKKCDILEISVFKEISEKNLKLKSIYFVYLQAATDNGSKVTGYTLEYDQGGGDRQFVEIYSGLQRQYKVTKLTASTGYTFRLAAVNSHGKRWVK